MKVSVEMTSPDQKDILQPEGNTTFHSVYFGTEPILLSPAEMHRPPGSRISPQAGVPASLLWAYPVLQTCLMMRIIRVLVESTKLRGLLFQ